MDPRGEFLALRRSMGLTQAEASRQLGLGRSTIAVYESGHGKIKPERWHQLIEALRAGTPSRAYAARPPRLRAAPSPKPEPTRHCDHKFVDSTSCLKCGWTPTAEDFASIARTVDPTYAPAPRRRTPRVRMRTCPLPRGAVDENEACICGSPRKRHDALKFSCQDCRRGSTGCQYFRPAGRFSGAA
jgi:hypothetical protein